MAEKSKKVKSVKKDVEKVKPLKKEKKDFKKVEKKNAVIGESKGNFWKNNKGAFIIIGVIALLIVLTLLIEGNEKTEKAFDYSTLGAEINTWYNDTQENQYVVTVIALSYCGYCAQYKPIITELATEEGLKLHWFEIDTMASGDAEALQYQYNLEKYTGSSPYTLITYNGEYVTDVVGYMEKEEITSFLENAGAL